VTVVLTAALRPDLELLARLRKHRVEVARLVGRSLARHDPAIGPAHAHQDSFVRDCMPYLGASLPAVDPRDVAARLWLVRGTVALMFASAAEANGAGPLGSNDVDAQLAALVAFCAGGLSAPSPPPVRRRETGKSSEGRSKKRR
jgi:hypothetical protein